MVFVFVKILQYVGINKAIFTPPRKLSSLQTPNFFYQFILVEQMHNSVEFEFHFQIFNSSVPLSSLYSRYLNSLGGDQNIKKSLIFEVEWKQRTYWMRGGCINTGLEHLKLVVLLSASNRWLKWLLPYCHTSYIIQEFKRHNLWGVIFFFNQKELNYYGYIKISLIVQKVLLTPFSESTTD